MHLYRLHLQVFEATDNIAMVVSVQNTERSIAQENWHFSLALHDCSGSTHVFHNILVTLFGEVTPTNYLCKIPQPLLYMLCSSFHFYSLLFIIWIAASSKQQINNRDTEKQKFQK